VMSDASVHLDVRFAFFCLGGSAIFGMAAPLVWGFKPGGFSLLLLGSVVLVQVVTARHWKHGVPAMFLKKN